MFYGCKIEKLSAPFQLKISLNLSEKFKTPQIFFTGKEQALAENFWTVNAFTENDFIVRVHAQASHDQRRWPLTNFRTVLSYFEEKYKARERATFITQPFGLL